MDVSVGAPVVIGGRNVFLGEEKRCDVCSLVGVVAQLRTI